MSEALMRLNNILFGYRGEQILKGLSISLDEGEMVGIVGPNGSGKSTLLRIMSGIFEPWDGTALLKGKPLASYSRKSVARIMASVSQDIDKDFPFTVREVVAMGRAPYLGRFALEGKKDKEVIEEVMELTDIARFADRFPYQLSGGERQRMIIARALAQEPELLLMDEPTSHLDLRHQMEVNRLILRMKEEKGLAVVYVTHDLNSAAECCSRIVMLCDGLVHAEGAADEVISSENIEAVYNCSCLVDQNPKTGRPRVTPLMGGGNG